MSDQQTTVKDNPEAAIAPVYLVFGNDEYPVSMNTRKLIERLCPDDQRAFGLEVIDGGADTVEEALDAVRKSLEALRTVGFLMSGHKVIWLRDVNFLSDSTRPGKSKTVKDAVQGLTDEIKRGWDAAQSLVISSPKVDKRTAFYKACKKAGEVQEYALPERGSEAEKEVRHRARVLMRRAKLEMDEEVFDCFIERAGLDTRLIVQELEKLALYKNGPGRVTRPEVEAMVCSSRDTPGWDFADAVAGRDLPRALRVLRRLMFQRESPVALLIALEKRFSQMLVLRASMDRGWCRLEGRDRRWRKLSWREGREIEQMFESYGRDDPRHIHPFRQGILAAQADEFSASELMHYQERIMRTHERMFTTGSVSHAVMLELLAIEIAGRLQKAV
jgi:DNA polymerase-3 subunit delta